MKGIIEGEMQMVMTIISALEDDRIVSYYQPIVSNQDSSIVRYESLVRLLREDGTIVYPDEFLYVAKKGKYYNLITQKVLEDAFFVLSRYNIELSVNLSIENLHSSYIRSTLLSLIERYPQEAKRLVVEILEDNELNDSEDVYSFIKGIKQYGVKIAIDDFGAGCSNYRRLLNYQPDIIKLDSCLIQNIENDNISKVIVKSIVSFAKELSLKTTAEYVENEKIFEIVKELGVDFSQGFYFSKAKEYISS